MTIGERPTTGASEAKCSPPLISAESHAERDDTANIPTGQQNSVVRESYDRCEVEAEALIQSYTHP